MGDDPQRLKKIAAGAYDYENDPKWAEYWTNILIPPHMASRPDVITHFRHKFYQKYIDPELEVEPMSSTTSSQSTRPSSTSSSPANGQARPRSTGSNTGTTTTTRTNAATRGQLRWDRQSIQFSVNAWVFVVTVLAILPLLPRTLSIKAYRVSLLGTAISSGYSLYSLYGKPRAWSLQAVQVWFQSVVPAKDFIYLLYCLIFVSSQAHLKFALLPVLCRVIQHVAKFLRRSFNHSNIYRKYLDEVCLWVESNTTTLSILSSNAEIAIGFLLIIALFSLQRNILQTFMYWQLLKLMYHVPATAGYHQSAWAKLGRIVNPFIDRNAPFLRTPLAAAQRWWFRQ